MTEPDRFEPWWQISGDGKTLLVYYRADRVYKAPRALWEEIWHAYANETGPLQVNEVCRRFNIQRALFTKIQRVLGLTHTSIPYPPWVTAETPTDELVERTLEQREDDYDRKLQQRSAGWYRTEWQKAREELRRSEIFARTVAQAVREMSLVDPAALRESRGARKGHGTVRSQLLLPITDWHVGKLVVESMLTAPNRFDVEVLRARVDSLAGQVIEFAATHVKTIDRLVVASLGDMVDNPFSDTYAGQAQMQAVHSTAQVRLALEVLVGFFTRLLAELPLHVEVIAKVGNHGRGGKPLSGVFDEFLFDPLLRSAFAGTERITVSARPNLVSTHAVGTSLCVFLHGAGTARALTPGRAEQVAALAEIGHGSGLFPHRYVFAGHVHHRRAGVSLEGNRAEWYYCPSLVGGDEYGETQMLSTSRPAQCAFLIHPVTGLHLQKTFYLDLV
jgi:hypothetical protein